MTTESQGFSGRVSNVPVTAKDFERWLADHRAEMSPELQALADRALLTLKTSRPLMIVAPALGLRTGWQGGR